MKQDTIDWRLVGNLTIVCFSLVSMSVAGARSVVFGEWLYLIGAVCFAMVAVVNMWVAISRIAQQYRGGN